MGLPKTKRRKYEMKRSIVRICKQPHKLVIFVFLVLSSCLSFNQTIFVHGAQKISQLNYLLSRLSNTTKQFLIKDTSHNHKCWPPSCHPNEVADCRYWLCSWHLYYTLLSTYVLTMYMQQRKVGVNVFQCKNSDRHRQGLIMVVLNSNPWLRLITLWPT